MVRAGNGLMSVGALITVLAFIFDVTVSSDGTGGIGAVANLDRLFVRQMILDLGGILFLAGAIFHGLGRVEEAIKSTSRRTEASSFTNMRQDAFTTDPPTTSVNKELSANQTGSQVSNNKVPCHACGHPNRPDARVCMSCGVPAPSKAK